MSRFWSARKHFIPLLFVLLTYLLVVMTAEVKEKKDESSAVNGMVTIICDKAAAYLREMSKTFFGGSSSTVKDMAEKTTESAITILSKALYNMLNGTSFGGTENVAKYLASAFDMVTANNSELLKSFFTSKIPDDAGL